MSGGNEAAAFIKVLVEAWECCGTCAGGVLERHDEQVRTEALRQAAEDYEAEQLEHGRNRRRVDPFAEVCQWLRRRACNDSLRGYTEANARAWLERTGSDE